MNHTSLIRVIAKSLSLVFFLKKNYSLITIQLLPFFMSIGFEL